MIKISECTVFRIPNEFNHYRLGITIKARANSVERNHVKRQIREYFRTHREDLGSFDYNVVIPGAKKLTHPYPRRLGKSLREQFLYAISTR